MGLNHQIVRVIDREMLVTADLAASLYTTGSKKPLTPGIYMVLWPSYIQTPKYDANARYVGPFRTIEHATLLVRICITEYFLEEHAAVGVQQKGMEQVLH